MATSKKKSSAESKERESRAFAKSEPKKESRSFEKSEIKGAFKGKAKRK